MQNNRFNEIIESLEMSINIAAPGEVGEYKVISGPEDIGKSNRIKKDQLKLKHSCGHKIKIGLSPSSFIRAVSGRCQNPECKNKRKQFSLKLEMSYKDKIDFFAKLTRLYELSSKPKTLYYSLKNILNDHVLTNELFKINYNNLDQLIFNHNQGEYYVILKTGKIRKMSLEDKEILDVNINTNNTLADDPKIKSVLDKVKLNSPLEESNKQIVEPIKTVIEEPINEKSELDGIQSKVDEINNKINEHQKAISEHNYAISVLKEEKEKIISIEATLTKLKEQATMLGIKPETLVSLLGGKENVPKDIDIIDDDYKEDKVEVEPTKPFSKEATIQRTLESRLSPLQKNKSFADSLYQLLYDSNKPLKLSEILDRADKYNLRFSKHPINDIQRSMDIKPSIYRVMRGLYSVKK